MRGWARHLLTFAALMAATLAPFILLAEILW